MSGPTGGAGREEEPKVVFRDRRRLDPETGKVRGTTVPDDLSGLADLPPADSGSDAAEGPSIGEAVLQGELEAAQQQAAERTADLQRVTAEYANYRKRVDRDREQVVTAAKAAVTMELLTVLDDIDRAQSHGDLTGSFKAVADKLVATLEKLGLQRFAAVGDVFDPAVHEAVQFETSTEVSEPTVTSVFRQGYTLGERLVRPAVVVVTGPEHESADAPQQDAPGA